MANLLKNKDAKLEACWGYIIYKYSPYGGSVATKVNRKRFLSCFFNSM